MNTQRGRISPKLNWRRRMRNTSQTICITKSLAALSLVAALAACGGGGGDSSTSSSTSGSSSSSGGSPSQTVTGTLSTPQYTSGSAQITAFNLLINTVPSAAFPRCRRTPYWIRQHRAMQSTWASTAPYRIAKHREAQDLPVRLIKIERWPQDCRLPRLAQV